MVATWTLLLVSLLTGRHDGCLIQRKHHGSWCFLPIMRGNSFRPALSSWALPRYGYGFSSVVLHADRLGPDERALEGETAAEEETLLCVYLRVQPDVTTDDALAAVSHFCQSFPFAAVLPVQPLHYLPLDGTGVEVKFLRKKTDLKIGVEGGIRFYVRAKHDDTVAEYEQSETSLSITEQESCSNIALNEDASSAVAAVNDATILDDETSSSNNKDVIEITAKRNSQGQVIQKLMSEKLIVTRFVAELQDQQLSERAMAVRPLEDVVTLSSVFHKWM